jgi:hypothetical protein
MNKPDMASLEAVRAKLVDLIIECPMENSRSGCPLAGKRRLSFDQRVSWLKSLSKEELEDIYAAHCHCMKTSLS